MQTTAIPKNHMDIPWHEYSGHGNCPITEADLTEKASIVGRVGLMLLSCGTGAWRVRSSMNTISQNLGITCSTDIGLMSIEYTCFDGTSGFSQSLLPDQYRSQAKRLGKSTCSSKQVYSIDIRPISVEHVIPRFCEIVFMELRTRQAPVPQDNSIRPTRPTIEAFSVRSASVIGQFPWPLYSCHGISM